MEWFNPDGSIRLPERILKQQKESEFRMREGLCAAVEKEVVSDKSPKKCILHITLSEKIKDTSFVEGIYSRFMGSSDVPSRLSRKSNNEFEVEIGTCFSRCKDCASLLNRFREFLDGNVILKKGSCSYEERNQPFCYEDYFG
ncbi:hypothetical protein KY347_04415 [Candidatus Woesearchaeota archaeon]|nr:hypothetical protein [Candidatus Woesearchaeota archaeon]